MADLVFVAAIFAFFALCVLYVNWCDRIVGPDESSSSPSLQHRSDQTGSIAVAERDEVTV